MKAGTAPRFLIVTADDFGLHEALNEAVYRAADDGVLSSASLMVAAPATADAVRRARELPQLRVGLHLVLADGWPTSPPSQVPDLIDANGRLGTRLFSEGLRSFLLPRVRRQLAAEIRAQFEAFARTGLFLDHVNAHKHLHLHPTLLDMIVRIGRDFGLCTMRLPHEPLWFAVRGGGAAAVAGAALLRPWTFMMRRRLRAAGIACNDQVFGISRSGAMDEATLLEILRRLPLGVSEIYLHPAVPAHRPLAAAMRSYRHTDELAALLSARVRAAVGRSQAACGGFRDAFNMAPPRGY